MQKEVNQTKRVNDQVRGEFAGQQPAIPKELQQ